MLNFGGWLFCGGCSHIGSVDCLVSLAGGRADKVVVVQSSPAQV